MGSFIIYNIALLAPLLFYITNNKNRIAYFVSAVIIILIAVFRYDVGWDYSGIVLYYDIVSDNSYSIFFKEPLLFMICKIFSNPANGFIYVFAVYFILTFFFLYKTLEYYDVLNEGMFMFIALGYLFITFDQIRQCLAISIFMFSFRYMERKDFLKFLLCYILAANAHFSALLLLPFYWLLRIRIPLWIYLVGVFLMVLLYYLEVWTNLRESLFSIIPYYNKYAERPEYLLSVKASSGVGVVFFIALSVLSIIYFKLIENRIIVNSIFFGLLIYLFASGNLNIYRVSNYFSFSIIVSVGLLLKNSSRNLFRAILIFSTIIWMQGLIYTNHAGCKPYNHIFSKEARERSLLEDEEADFK